MDPSRLTHFAGDKSLSPMPPDLAAFWCWLADQVPTAKEFRDLSDADKTALALMLRAGPTRYGPH